MQHRENRMSGAPPSSAGPGEDRPVGLLGAWPFRSWLIIGASLAGALAIYFGFLGTAWVDVVARWTAASTSAGLNLFGVSTRVDGTVLSSGAFAVDIVAECTAVGPLLVFMGAVLAYPSTLRAKWFGWLLGLVILSTINLGRIMSLFWIGSAFPEYLSVAHLLVWQTAIIVLAIALWLLWAERFARARNV